MIAARSRLLLFFFAIAATGCGALVDGPPANRCEGNADCSAGTCDLERTMCVSQPPEAMRIGIEVVPATDPYGGTPLPVSFPPFEVTGSRDFEVPLGVSVLHALSDAVASVADHRICPRLDAPATPERVLLAVEDVRARM